MRAIVIGHPDARGLSIGRARHTPHVRSGVFRVGPAANGIADHDRPEEAHGPPRFDDRPS